jgi:hypothetical protein
MKRIITILALYLTGLLAGCGTPNDPESIMGDDGGYKIVSKCATSAFAQDVVVNDTVAYLAQGEGGLGIINISNPAKPKLISTILDIRGYSYKIALYDSVIFIASGTFGVTYVTINNPTFLYNDRTISPAKDFGFFSNFMFVATSEEGVRIVNVTYLPSYLETRGTLVTSGFAQGVVATQDSMYLIAACGEAGLAFYDYSQVKSAGGWGDYYPVGLIDLPGYAENLTLNPSLKYAYVACGTAGLIIVDYSDSANAKIVGSYNTGGYAKELFYYNNKIYIATELRGLQIIDVSNVSAPVRIGTVQTQFAKGVTADDKYIYVADENEGLVIISIPH